MPSLSKFVCAAAACALFFTAAACAQPEADAAETQAAAEAASAEAVALIAGEEITLAELDAFLRDKLVERETQGDSKELRRLHVQELENLINRRLWDAEADAQGKGRDQLLDEIAAQATAPTEDEVRDFFDENRGQMGPTTFEEIAPRIREHLLQQAQAEALQNFSHGLREKNNVEVLLKAFRHEVNSEGTALGPADAPVTVVEFSDYQCPFCVRAEPTVKRLLREYEGRVRFVYKHFPIDAIHPDARAAAEAASCAEEQAPELFWEYHDRIFAQNARFESAVLDTLAQDVDGLDLQEFRACMEERRFADRVQKDISDGEVVGVNSTPTFFINGVEVLGAQPYEEFQRVIDRELAAVGAAG